MAYGGESPSPAPLPASAIVSGREVIIHADDPTIKGGAWYPLSVKKIVRALDIAIENRLPVIHLCDSAGGLLQLQSEAVPGPSHGRPDVPQPVAAVEDGRQATGAGVRPLHSRRRLYSRALATTTSSCAAQAQCSSAARRWCKRRDR